MTSIAHHWQTRSQDLRGPEANYYLGWLDALTAIKTIGTDEGLTDLAVLLHSETYLAEAEMFFEGNQ